MRTLTAPKRCNVGMFAPVDMQLLHTGWILSIPASLVSVRCGERPMTAAEEEEADDPGFATSDLVGGAAARAHHGPRRPGGAAAGRGVERRPARRRPAAVGQIPRP